MLRIELHPMAQALIVQRVKNHPPGPVRGMTGSLYRFFAVITGMTPEVPLRDFTFCIAAERDAHVLKLVNHTGSVHYHDLNGVLVSKIITSLDRIEHMPFPAVFFLIAYRCRYPALGCS
ncbi:Uncharacterised protein [uncultured archaeon]|nr:Uncharacterised protein [uncultured archaeon]